MSILTYSRLQYTDTHATLLEMS